MNKPDKKLETMIHQYVCGRLSEAEALDFESSFLGDPDVISLIEAEQALQQGLVVATQGVANQVMPDPIAADKLSTKSEERANRVRADNTPWYRKLSGWLMSPIPVPALAMSLLALGVVPIVSMVGDEPNNIDNIMIVNGATEVTRTLEGPQSQMLLDLSVPDGAVSALMIKVQTSTRPYEKYRLKIISNNNSSDNGKAVWESTPFTLNSLGHGLIIVPREAAIKDALINVTAMLDDGNEKTVKFCHYSEVCR